MKICEDKMLRSFAGSKVWVGITTCRVSHGFSQRLCERPYGQMLPNTWSTNVMNPQHFEFTLSTIKLPAEARSWSVAWGCLKARSSRFHFWNWDTRGSKWLETTQCSNLSPSTQAGLPSSRSSDSRPPQHVQFWVCIPADPQSPRSRSDRCNRQPERKKTGRLGLSLLVINAGPTWVQPSWLNTVGSDGRTPPTS